MSNTNIPMNPHDWSGKESELAFNKVRHVIDLLHQNFGGDLSVHVGVIYLAVGGNGGRSTSRYLLFLPYYNPSVHGYNFSIQHPFVFARGFPGTASLNFYAWLDSEWTKAVTESNDNSELMECSPILFCKFGALENAEFEPVPWKVSVRGKGTMVATDSGVECWIHGPMASPSMEMRILKSIKENYSAQFMCLLNGTEADKTLEVLMENLMEQSNSFSFPTIQMKIDSPMMGLVPFDVKPVRLKIGGEIAAGDRETNDVHIPVTKPGFAVRRISFQRLWDILYNSTSLTIDPKRVRDIRETIRRTLNC